MGTALERGDEKSEELETHRGILKSIRQTKDDLQGCQPVVDHVIYNWLF